MDSSPLDSIRSHITAPFSSEKLSSYMDKVFKTDPSAYLALIDSFQSLLLHTNSETIDLVSAQAQFLSLSQSAAKLANDQITLSSQEREIA
jgi:hypothetical protein